MDIVQVDQGLASKVVDEIPALMHATGPVSYDYHFERRAVFDALVRRSWMAAGTLFGSDAATVALDGDALLGVLISFPGPEFRERQAALASVWPDMIPAGEVTEAEIGGVLERAGHASWLNPVVRPEVYYVHALSVKPEHRGKQVGAALLGHAMDEGRRRKLPVLELDVLSDNPAVRFYRAMGLELLVESRAPKPEAYGVPPEWRMGMTLSPAREQG